MMTQIQDQHREQLAYVYLRQSTLGQVLHHRESTERHYDLKAKALQLGWPAERIRVFDGDLATSAKPLSQREDFKTMIVDVSMKRVGAIFVLEATRRTMMVTRVGTVAIIILVLLVQMIPQPWRGIIDAGVVVGLSWGVLSLWYLIFRAFKTGFYPCSPDVPDMVPEQT